MTLWSTVFPRRDRGGPDPEPDGGPPVLVDQLAGLLLVRVSPADRPGPQDVAELAGELAAREDPRRIATVVVGAEGRAPATLGHRLSDILDTLQADGVTTVRLVLYGAGGAVPDDPLAQRIADAWGFRVIAPEGEALIVPGGALFAPDSHDPSRGWQLFTPGGHPRPLGSRDPAPNWQGAFGELAATAAGGCVVEQIPAGVLLRSPREAPPQPGDLCYAMPPDPDHPLVVLGTPDPAGGAGIPSDDLSALLAALPADVRGKVRVVSGSHRDVLPAVQEAADSLGIEVELLTSLPLLADGEGAEGRAEPCPVLVDRDAVPTWRPFAEAVVCRPAGADGAEPAEPRLLRWRRPVPGIGDDGQGTVHLSQQWRVTVLRAGLHLGLRGEAPPPVSALPVTADRLTVDIGSPGRPLDESVVPVLSRLLYDLDPRLRAFIILRTQGTSADGGRLLRRVAVQHGVRLLYAPAPAAATGTRTAFRSALVMAGVADMPDLSWLAPAPWAAAGAEPVRATAVGEVPGPGRDSGAVPAEYREDLARVVSAAEAGQYRTAADLAESLDRRVSAAYGENAPSTLEARQVRAHVARLGGDNALAADLYRDVAVRVLAAGGPGVAEADRAAANADACWRAVRDSARAGGMAGDMLALLRRFPAAGRRLRAAEDHLARLSEPSAGAPHRAVAVSAPTRPADGGATERSSAPDGTGAPAEQAAGEMAAYG
ncbi:hypothetical protein [Streptomyces sp. NPDC052036]|uniref:hypothetical protein n=1 Tax=Streptomyces sp. NPDC052036 TaxID=3155171 RepID=UPI0034245D3F